MTKLTDDDWLQVEQAASGCVSGTSDEWPALRAAIEKITGKPFGRRKPAAWLQGFCEGVLAGRARRHRESMLPNTYRPTKQMLDWMDINGIPKIDRVRCSLLRVARLACDGLTLEQIKEHRIVRRKRAMAPYIDDFYAKWSEANPASKPLTQAEMDK